MNILRSVTALAAVACLSSAAFAELAFHGEAVPTQEPILSIISLSSADFAEEAAKTAGISAESVVPIKNASFSMSSMEDPEQAPGIEESLQTDEAIAGCEAECGGCGCAPINCCCYLPTFYGYVETVFLHRDNRVTRQQLVYDTGLAPGSNTLVSTRDFDFDFEPGIRVLFGWQVNECCAIEFGYLGGLNWASRIHVHGSNNLAIPGDLGLASNDFYNADEMRLDYSSNLNSYELNFVKTCCCCCCCIPGSCCADETCGPAGCGEGCGGGCGGGCGSTCGTIRGIRSLSIFTGFRYLSLDEVFNIQSTDLDEGTSDYNIRTMNDLYGWQIGAAVRRCRGRVGWDLTGKAGIYGNWAEQSQSVGDFPPPFMLRSQRATSASNVAFVGELGLSAWYQFAEHFAVRGGYNLFWIEGVALAPDQLDFTNTPSSGTALYAGNGVFLHGVNIGLEWFF